jgi:predicted membrane channel-forming protein YqfA (hemolysin III family)
MDICSISRFVSFENVISHLAYNFSVLKSILKSSLYHIKENISEQWITIPMNDHIMIVISDK